MNVETCRGKCPTCNEARMLQREAAVSVMAHLFLTIFTAGLYLFLMPFVVIRGLVRPWRCTMCGTISRPYLFG